MAELVFGLLVRHVRHNYDGTAGTELRGKRIGLLAYGNVARCVARIARGFEMEVSAYDFFNRVERIEEDGTYAAHNLYDLVQQCDIVSLHTPATPRTREFVNREMIELMRPGGILINTARKEIIHEDELLQLLTERTDLSYLTDIRPDRHEEFVAALGNRYYATPKKARCPNRRSQCQCRPCRRASDCRLLCHRRHHLPRQSLSKVSGASSILSKQQPP